MGCFSPPMEMLLLSCMLVCVAVLLSWDGEIPIFVCPCKNTVWMQCIKIQTINKERLHYHVNGEKTSVGINCIYLHRHTPPRNSHPDSLLNYTLNLSFFFWVTAFTKWCNMHYSKTWNVIVTVLETNGRILYKCHLWLAAESHVHIAGSENWLCWERSKISASCAGEGWVCYGNYPITVLTGEGSDCCFASVPHVGWLNHKWNATLTAPHCTTTQESESE